MKKISVIGAGTWGIVIASLLADNGHEVLVYARNKDEARYINDTHTHSKLPGITLNENVKVDSNLENVAKDRDAIIFAIPSVAFREVVHNTIPYLK
ncbi:MAG: NAD(P)-binding domain-containing protein, partial [Lachnospiraceae bacterium]|nr:NAD(P)-binding domain-containing protein [Lachnospiraceae bacterium]